MSGPVVGFPASGYLLDSNHAGRLTQVGHPLQRRVTREAGRGVRFYLCTVVASEMRFGLRSRRKKAASAEWRRIRNRLIPLPLDIIDAETAADLRVTARLRGRTVALPDALIAAAAVRHGLTLLTADGDFARLPGVRVENWLTP